MLKVRSAKVVSNEMTHLQLLAHFFLSAIGNYVSGSDMGDVTLDEKVRHLE